VQGLQDDDTRIRFLVADFILSRARSRKPEEVDSALQSLLRMAQNSSNGGLVENPYVQLQTYLANGLLSIDDL
jgi:ADP-ribosylglycohydrolase